MTAILLITGLLVGGYWLLRSASASGSELDALHRYEFENKDSSGLTLYRSYGHYKAHDAEKQYVGDMVDIKSRLGAFMIATAFAVALVNFF